MYTIKKTKVDGEQVLVLVKKQSFVHPSIIKKDLYVKVLDENIARHQCAVIACHALNDKITDDEIEKFDILTKTFETPCAFESYISEGSVFGELPNEYKRLMSCTLYAQDKLFWGLKYSEKSGYSLDLETFTFKEFTPLYKWCDKNIEKFNLTFDNSNLIKEIKPLYSEAAEIFDHPAVDGICKKWEENVREHHIQEFIKGLFADYKLANNGTLKEYGPLYKRSNFDKYMLSWLISNGQNYHNDTTKKEKRNFTSVF